MNPASPSRPTPLRPAGAPSSRAGLRLAGLGLAAALASTALTGCFPVLVGGAVVGGVIASDRRPPGQQLRDETMESRVERAIAANLGTERIRAKVVAYNGRVLLVGEAASERERGIAEQAAAKVPEVRAVINDLAVTSSPTLRERTSDTVITTKVKASIVDAKDISINAFEIVTERGVVYLMGRVTAREADRATDLAAGVDGVMKVVRLFEVISEQELAATGTAPAATASRAPVVEVPPATGAAAPRAAAPSPAPAPAAAQNPGVVVTPIAPR
ncbi:MAG: BON domain-containing protein [Xylophilus ampelinus]